MIGVSVPFRGFRGLQGGRRRRVADTPMKFQSPSGVLGVCRRALRGWVLTGPNVSVPFRGFRGLQGGTADFRTRRVRRRVSVPFRGFRGLQGSSGGAGGNGGDVSVPFRGVRGLQAK